MVSNGSDGNPQFQYAMNPAGFGEQTWSFSTTADAAGPTTLGYDYRGFHAYYDVQVFLRAFVVRNGTRTTFALVNAGPTDCCTPPSGGFTYTGPVTLDLQVGDTYGFEFGGRNFDRNNQLNGTLIVMLPTPVATTLTADPPVQGLFTLRARLTTTATGDPVPGQTIVMSTSAGEVCRATTDANGFASCSGLGSAPQIVQEGGYTASFAGTPRFAPSTTRAMLLQVATTTTTQATTTTTATTTTPTTGVTTTTTRPGQRLPATGQSDGRWAWVAMLLLGAVGFGFLRSTGEA